MSRKGNSAADGRKIWKWVVGLLLANLAGLVTLMIWFGGGVTIGGGDPLFRDKPESEWIKNVAYSDEKQVEEWRSYGEEGVQVLIRGLERANPRGERAYRRVHPRLPRFLSRWLPAPKSDSTRSTRMCLVSLLSGLGNDAQSAIPVMIRTLNRDEDRGVRQIAIGFFTSSEDEKCLINQMPPDEKKRLLPALIRALQDPADWGLRNNAALALRWYPEQREIVAPILVIALSDSQPQVRRLAAVALNQVDADMAARVGAVRVLAELVKHPDDQIAGKAAADLPGFQSQSDVAVLALIDGVESTNSYVACSSVWALQRITNHMEWVRAALEKAALQENDAARYAKRALRRLGQDTPGGEGDD